MDERTREIFDSIEEYIGKLEDKILAYESEIEDLNCTIEYMQERIDWLCEDYDDRF